MTHHHDPFRAPPQGRAPRLRDTAVDRPVHVHAHVDRYPPFVNAGAEWMIHAMLRHLVGCGHRATVTTAVEARAVVDGVEVFPTGYADECAVTADVVVGHLLWTREVIQLAERHELPLLYLVHNDFQLHSWAVRPSDVTAAVFNSEWVAAAVNWPGTSAVIRPPCRVLDYRIRREDPQYTTLVNMNADKGAELFYWLASKRAPRPFLAVCGAYGNQMAPTLATPNVEWQPPTGRIVEDVYRRTRVLLVPSRYESWGRVAVEAMCSGIPVIAHPTPGLRESLGDAAMFVDRDDQDGWLAALSALDDPAVYRQWSGAAVQRAALLDLVSTADLAEWEKLVRRCVPSTEEAVA